LRKIRTVTFLKGKIENLIYYVVLYAVALFGSIPLLSSASIPPGFDSVMHLSKIRILTEFFPSIPKWFPWWYCGTPSLRFYPPSSYLATTFICWISQVNSVEAYQLTDLFSFFLAGLSMYLFMKSLGFQRFSSFASAVFYMLSPQTLYGRFFIGHFTHNFSMFLIPLTFYMMIKFGNHVWKMILISAPLFALLILTHLQTALSFGFMLVIYILSNAVLCLRGGDRKSINNHIKGIFLCGAIGVSLAGFWLYPCLMEGSGSFILSLEDARRVMFPIETLFVDSANLNYLEPLQQLWTRQYFLGYPVITLATLAVVLIARGKLSWKKRSWGVIFASWTAFFLFSIIAPTFGVILGWPNRLPYFVSMTMAMLASIAVDWIVICLREPRSGAKSSRTLITYFVLALLVLSPLIHTYNMEKFVYLPYTNEIEAANTLKTMGLNIGERVASFGTFSYVFNVFSDAWQLDGGYTQGQINPDFYYKYSAALGTDDVDSVLEILNETNTRYVVMPESEVTSVFENQTFFERTETPGYVIFKLKDAYQLDFIAIEEGETTVSYEYTDPDMLQIHARNCSSQVILLIKMNYYTEWVASATQDEVRLTENSNGLMQLEISNSDSLDITLRYDYTQTDYTGLAATIAGVTIYLLLFVTAIWKAPNEWVRAGHRGATAKHLINGEKKAKP
jgi:hypothetical protein